MKIVVQIWYLKMVTFTVNKLLAGNNYALFQEMINFSRNLYLK